MPRPQKCRRIRAYPDHWSFSPDSGSPDGTVILTLDELEAIRLIDKEQKTQEQCAAEMEVARTIVTAIYDSARKKLAEAGIRLYAGNSGSADAAVKSFIEGSLVQITNATCDHHGHGEGHSCGSHGCH